MIFVTGDTHGDFYRFTEEEFPEQKEMTRADTMIICGDFGGVWCGDERDNEELDKLAQLPFTIVFVSGNHENFDALAKYPVEEWNGGKVQFIRPNVIHLLRGQIVTIEGLTFFGMGGAASHDIADGILDPYAPDFEIQYWFMRRNRALFRVNHYSWWKEEMPSSLEYLVGLTNLEKEIYSIDYIITHCAPHMIYGDDVNKLTEYFNRINNNADFKHWYFGHYHEDRKIGDKHTVVYQEIIKLED